MGKNVWVDRARLVIAWPFLLIGAIIFDCGILIGGEAAEMSIDPIRQREN